METLMSALGSLNQSELEVPLAGRMKKSMPAILTPIFPRVEARFECNGTNPSRYYLEPTESWFVQQALIAHGVEFSLGLFSSEPTRCKVPNQRFKVHALSVVHCLNALEDNRP